MTRPTSVRRLEAMVIGLAIVFAAIAAVPFAASLQPGGAADPGYLDVDVARIEPGSYTVVEWEGRPIAVVRVSPQMLADLQAGTVRTWSRVPVRDFEASVFVYQLISTHLGCGLLHEPKGNARYPADADWRGGFYDPCHFGQWDYAGRAVRVSEGNTQLPGLRVPKYSVPSDLRVRLYR